MDAKYKDVEAMEDGSILLTLFNGGIRNDENEHIANCCAVNRKILVAFGSCACEGCIPGLANLSSRWGRLPHAFNTVTTDNPNQIYPRTRFDRARRRITIPDLSPVLRPWTRWWMWITTCPAARPNPTRSRR
jgi:F420-non-reducing hydrogenase small subunit